MPVAFLVVALIGGAFTLLALGAPRRPAILSFPFFMAGWITGDLALFHVAWQAAATVVFVAFGALARSPLRPSAGESRVEAP